MYRLLERVDEIIKKFQEENIDIKLVEIWHIPKIKAFFTQYMGKPENMERPLDTITYIDISNFLETFKEGSYRKQNYYQALKKFFEFTYQRNITHDVMNQVKQPILNKNVTEYIGQKDIEKIQAFLQNDKENISDRLLIGFLLYTGLTREYIFELRNENISTGNIDYSLYYTNKYGENISIPLNDNLIALLKEYLQIFKLIKPYEKIFPFNKPEGINRKVSSITKRLLGRNLTPTHFSNTFIKNCLKRRGNINYIAHFLSESVSTISKHNDIEDEEVLFNAQKKLLNSIYKYGSDM